MNKGLIALGVIVVIVIAAFGWYQGGYNQMVALDQQVKSSWAQVENQLQRRFDLIPNLVNTVKGYASHEKEIFERIAEARGRLLNAQGPAAKAEASGELNNWIGRLLAIAENYPNLKANESFIRLQDELTGTENRIAVERMRYNETVNAYNVTVRGFPTNIMAGMFGFKRSENYFEGEKSAQEAPKVQF